MRETPIVAKATAAPAASLGPGFSATRLSRKSSSAYPAPMNPASLNRPTATVTALGIRGVSWLSSETRASRPTASAR